MPHLEPLTNDQASPAARPLFDAIQADVGDGFPDVSGRGGGGGQEAQGERQFAERHAEDSQDRRRQPVSGRDRFR